MADEEVEVAVSVEVGEGGGGRPAAIAAEPGLLGDVLEGAIASVPIEGVAPPSGDEEVGMPVVVDIPNRHTVAEPPGE